MSFWSRIFAPSVQKAEGDWHAGPYQLPISGGWLPAGSTDNFWQMGNDLRPYGQPSAMVEACVSGYAQTVAMCPGDHWMQRSDGGRDRITTSALSRIIVEPNDYQSISDFLLGLTTNLYSTGNAYVLLTRNARNEVAQMHLMRSRESGVRIGTTGEIFYSLGGNEIIDRRLGKLEPVPARDVMHVRLKCPVHPLVGVSPLLSAMLEVAAGDAMMRQQLQFYMNQARPSIGLSTDEILDEDQTNFLRANWDRQTKGSGAGGTPIMTAGLKPVFFDRTSADGQLADMLKISSQQVALAFRVPLQILGIGQAAVTSTETLMSSWRATGLGFALGHIEEAFGRTFRLRGYPVEYLELNTDMLLRSAFRDQIEALARGVQAGIYAPNEARNRVDLGNVENGKEPRVQQQMVPLSFGMALDPTAPSPATTPSAPADEADDETDSEASDAEKHVSSDILARIHAAASRLQ